MKHARVAYRGTIQNAVEKDGFLQLSDGRMVTESDVVWLPPIQPRRPKDVTFMHYECELVVVIGKTGRNIKKESAYDYVSGYTIANDYAIRDYLENYYRPNLRVKNRDACTPIGPWFVDAHDVND